MNILFLVPYPRGKAPSQRFRFEQYLPILESKNIQYHFEPFLDNKTWDILYKPGQALEKALGILKGFLKRFLLLFSAGKYDYVFIHREASPIGPPVFEWFLAKVLNKKIIYDFDDAIWLANTSEANKIVAGIKFHDKVKSICRWAYKVSCGNDYLCNFASKYSSRVVLNPTTIDTEEMHNPALFPNQENKAKLTIGWTGTHSTLPYLNELVPVLQRLEQKYDFEFCVIANRKPELPLKSLKFVPWKKETEIADLMKFDIGLMPLTADKWAEGKCGFKALQYMALSVPALVSPVGVNTKIVDHGVNGFICENDQDWEKYLELLITDPDLRKKMGEKAREKIINNYSVLSNSQTFLSLFSEPSV